MRNSTLVYATRAVTMAIAAAAPRYACTPRRHTCRHATPRHVSLAAASAASRASQPHTPLRRHWSLGPPRLMPPPGMPPPSSPRATPPRHSRLYDYLIRHILLTIEGHCRHICHDAISPPQVTPPLRCETCYAQWLLLTRRLLIDSRRQPEIGWLRHASRHYEGQRAVSQA